MNVNVQTLSGLLRRGDEIVAMLLAPSASMQRLRLSAIMADEQRLGELCHAVNNLRDHLQVLALESVPVQPQPGQFQPGMPCLVFTPTGVFLSKGVVQEVYAPENGSTMYGVKCADGPGLRRIPHHCLQIDP